MPPADEAAADVTSRVALSAAFIISEGIDTARRRLGDPNPDGDDVDFPPESNDGADAPMSTFGVEGSEPESLRCPNKDEVNESREFSDGIRNKLIRSNQSQQWLFLVLAV